MAEVHSGTKKRRQMLIASDELAERVRLVATHRKMTIWEILDKYLGPVMAREYRKVADEMNRDIGGEGG